MPCIVSRIAAVAACLAPAAAFADDRPPDANGETIVVYGRAIQQVGVAASGSEGVVGYADFENRPIARAGELAENVPGLIATQHSGSGKANQYLLRGFNLDHGTDLAGFVDGAPINMRSHGHGQGYLDLNFLIPELVERIDYAKGPYHAQNGDFSSAGSMRFSTRSRLSAPFAEATVGPFGYRRGVVAGSTDLGRDAVLLGAIEGTLSDGPWVLPERGRKFNGLAKISTPTWSLGFSGYINRWTSTDQVPERALASGLIPRNGFIDADLGGRSGRAALTFNGTFGQTRVSAFAIASRLRLVSNFTYFLDDPVNGDEFAQVDRRGVFGGSAQHEIAGDQVTWRFGGDTRWDRIGTVGLYRTVAGQSIETVRQDQVSESSGGLFGEAEVKLGGGLRAVLGLRGDLIGYRVRSNLAGGSGSGSATLLAPKVALAWRLARGVEAYANYGEGFHSNDVRGAAGTLPDRVPIMSRSRGEELGLRVERGPFTASLVAFRLDLGSELVFVGDAGTTEPNAPSRRTGAELSMFWKPSPELTFDGSAAWTRARFRDVAQGEDYIPGATPLVIGAGVSAMLPGKIALTARVRHFAGTPLIEDASQRSQATTLVNIGSYGDVGRVRVSGEMLNLLNTRAPDVTYFYASRLPGEPADGVEDRHLHPVEPRQLRVTVRVSF